MYICKTHKQGESHKWADPTNRPKNSNDFQLMGLFSSKLGWKSYVIPTNGPVLTTGLKIICHSHKWADFMLTVTVTWRYVSRMTPVANRKKQKTPGTGNHYTAHTSAGNRFQAAAVAVEELSDVYVLKDRNILNYEQFDTVQFLFMEIL